MKTIGKFYVVSCLVFAFSSSAVADGADNRRYAFSFDNGAGLYGNSVHYRFNSRHGDFYSHNGTPVSQFFIHRGYGAGAFHYGGTLSEDEQHYYGGLSFGSATLAYFQGEAESFSKASNPIFNDLNQYFFHGGSRSSFKFRGAGANIELANGFSTQFTVSTVTAPNVDDRHGYYTGIAHRYFEAGVFQLDRGGERVGQGLNLGYSRGNVSLDYQEIRSEYGANLRRAALGWSKSPWWGFSVELEQAQNDLFSRDDEQRVMFRFRKKLGRTSSFSVTDTQENKTGFGKLVGVGVGVGIAAVALSSGSSDNDAAQRFAVRNDAAFAVFNDINPVSVQENREHGGWIFRNADNTFGFTEPVAGMLASVNIGDPGTSVPQGTAASASYHTHGGPDPRFDNENFSPQDTQTDRARRVDGYLGTPAGFMKLHDYRSGSITVVGRINN